MKDRYSVFGPETRFPSDMLCAILVSVEFKITSYKSKEEKAVVEPKKGRFKYRRPKITCKGGAPQCTCENSCSDAKYSRNVHLVLKNNPRLFYNPPRDCAEWKLEYNARTSAERRNKWEK